MGGLSQHVQQLGALHRLTGTAAATSSAVFASQATRMRLLHPQASPSRLAQKATRLMEPAAPNRPSATSELLLEWWFDAAGGSSTGTCVSKLVLAAQIRRLPFLSSLNARRVPFLERRS